MTDMKDFKETSNNENLSTESDGNIKMNVDLHGKITDENNLINPLITSENNHMQTYRRKIVMIIMMIV